jgi:hypothetical protein
MLSACAQSSRIIRRAVAGCVIVVAASLAGQTWAVADGPPSKPKVTFEVHTIPAHPVAGQPFQYVVTAHNVGKVPSGPVKLNQPIPKGVQILSSPRICTSRKLPDQSTLLHCKWKNIPYKKSSSVVFKLFPDPTLSSGSIVIGKPELTYGHGQHAKTSKGKQGSGLNFTVVRHVDLGLASAGQVGITQGETATVSLTAISRGPSAADDVVISGTLPPGVMLATAEPFAGGRWGRAVIAVPSPCTLKGRVIRCVLGRLMPGQKRGIRLTLRASPHAKPGTYVVPFRITCATPDTSPKDNVVQVRLRVDPMPRKGSGRARSSGGLGGGQSRAGVWGAHGAGGTRTGHRMGGTRTGHSAGGTRTGHSAGGTGTGRRAGGTLTNIGVDAGTMAWSSILSIPPPVVPPVVPPPAAMPPPPPPPVSLPPVTPPAKPTPEPQRNVHTAKAIAIGAKTLSSLLLLTTFVVTAVAGAAAGGGDASFDGGDSGSGKPILDRWDRVPWPIVGYRAVGGLLALSLTIRGFLGNIGDPLFSPLDYLSALGILATTFAGVVLLIGAARPVAGVIRGAAVFAVVMSAVAYLGMPAQGDSAGLAGVLMYVVVPLLLVVDWLLDAPAGRLDAVAARLWLCAGAGFLGYALVRGSVNGHYPEVYLDPRRVGYAPVALHCFVLVIAMVVTAALLVWTGNRFRSRSREEL